MYRVFGSSFASLKGAILFVALLVVLVFAYHRVIQYSIRNHPDCTLRAAQDHCRYMLGKQLGKMPRAEFEAELQRCNEIRVRLIEASGGVLDPVIVRITLEAQPHFLQNMNVLIFKSADISPGSLNFLSGFQCMLSGNWKFNSNTSYSSVMFYGSF